MARAFCIFSLVWCFNNGLSVAESELESTFEVTKNCQEALQTDKARAPESNEIRIASYNVENLFDTEHDEGKVDFEFLPAVSFETTDTGFKYVSGSKEKFNFCLARFEMEKAPCSTDDTCLKHAKKNASRCLSAHWDQALLQAKLSQLNSLFKTLFQAAPDILVLEEVENTTAVKAFVEKTGIVPGPLTCTSSNACTNPNGGLWMTDSGDERGIDIAIIYRNSPKLSFMSAQEHDPEVGGVDPTRNILEARFLAFGKSLTIFGNHWPSQRGPTELRLKAASKLRKLMTKDNTSNPPYYALALGDFNVINEERPRPFEDVLLSGIPSILDMSTLAAPYLPPLSRKGTYYFKPKVGWNYLDRIFLTESLHQQGGPLYLDPQTLQVHHHLANISPQKGSIYRDFATVERRRAAGEIIPFADLVSDTVNDELKELFASKPKLEVVKVTETCAPRRFSKADGTGFSDHFPVSILLRANP